MTRQIRRQFTPQEQTALLRQPLLEGQPVSDDCDSHGLKPSLFYRWQKACFEDGAAAFEKTDRRTAQAQQRRTAELEARLKQKDNVIAERMADLINEQKDPGGFDGVWVQPELREWAEQTELPASRLAGWIGMGASTFFDWKRCYGQVNEHNAWAPRGHWLADWEKQAIIDCYPSHPDDGYRRVTYMMMDADMVAASPGSVYRVLSQAGALRRWEAKPGKKGKGFVPRSGWLTDRRGQPTRIGTSTCPV